MKKILIVFIVLGVLVAGFFAFNKYIYSEKQGGEVALPTLEQYKLSGDIFVGNPAKPNFDSYPLARQFTTKLNEGYKAGPNFALKYTIISWGCGTSCQSSAILDTETGDIVTFGIISAYGLSYSPESKLLIVNPKENIPEALLNQNPGLAGEHYPLGSVPGGSDYYVFENGELRFLDRYNFSTGEGAFCIQVVTPARNPVTEEVREFGSPCSIPFGWEALETAEGTI